MTILLQGDRLYVPELAQLTATEARSFRAAVLAALSPEVRHLELDLSQTRQFDCAGLGALLALRKSLLRLSPPASLSLRNPSPQVLRLLQLTRTDQLLSCPRSEDCLTTGFPPHHAPARPRRA